MGLLYPNRSGFIESFKSVNLLEGADVFDGLRKVELTPEISGAETVKTNRRKPQGHVAGDASITGSMTLLYRSALDYQQKHPFFLYEIHSLTFTTEERVDFTTVAIEGLRWLSFPILAEGTNAIEVEVKFEALDCLMSVNGEELKSIFPEASEQFA